MRIAIEASLANEEKKTGLGVYTDKLLAALAEQARPEDTFFLLHSRKKWSGRDYGKNFIPVSYACTNSQFLSILFCLNRTLKKLNVDLFHVFCNAGSPPKCAVTLLTTVHDLFFLTAKDLPFKTKAILKLMFRWTIRNSLRFISNSETTKDSLISFGIPAQKITPVYPGADSIDLSGSSPAQQLPPCYLCVGALESRKGQTMLVDAYLQALQKRPDLPDLVLIGPDRGDGGKIRNRMAASAKIKWIDYVSSQDLASYYKNSKAFFLPSYQEGFGLPLIEAMSAGLPVICSDIPVFREIAGDHAVFLKPEKEQFSAAFENFETFAFDTAAAKAHALAFTWKRTAAELYSIYDKWKEDA